MNWIFYFLCAAAARNGQVGVLDWIHQHHPVPVNSLLCAAAPDGHIPVLLWLKETVPIDLNNVYVWWEAAFYGHLHVLEWL